MINLMGTFGVHQGIASYRKSKDGGPSGTEQGGLCDFGQNGVGATAIAGGGDPKASRPACATRSRD